MLRTFDDKKIAITSVAVARAYFIDHGQAISPALREFVEAGLDVVASVIEREEPPTWFEVAALVLLGMAQVVAGTLMIDLCPLGGELLGNTLINAGIDDLICGVTCSIRCEFAWED